VDTRGIAVDSEAATGVALITVEASGQNTIIVVSGANANITPEHVERQAGLIQSASLLVMQLESPLDAVMAATRLASQAGVKVLLNPAPAQSLPTELLRNVDLLAPNQTELSLLVEAGNVAEAAQKLIEMGVGVMVVTLGNEGSYILSPDMEIPLPAFPVSAIDTVAAGDAFIGAFAVAIAEGKPLREAARWGNAAGAIAVTRLGAQPSLPRREEVLALLEEKE
jgi:ribokinase